jgi:C1A family cysteine protease
MYPGYCLYYVYRTEQTFFDEGAFWKVQNSWGDSWGDKGFAYFEADGTDNGSCNMYQYAS